MIAVKIRGFRIELSEIENAINATEGVEKGVVVDVVHRESKRLAAYLLMARGVARDPAELRSRRTPFAGLYGAVQLCGD